MADKLKDKFCAYTESVQAKLRRKSGESPGKGPLKLYSKRVLELQTAVAEAESKAEFQSLTKETRSLFSGNFHGKSESVRNQWTLGAFRSAASPLTNLRPSLLETRVGAAPLSLYQNSTPELKKVFIDVCGVGLPASTALPPDYTPMLFKVFYPSSTMANTLSHEH